MGFLIWLAGTLGQESALKNSVQVVVNTDLDKGEVKLYHRHGSYEELIEPKSPSIYQMFYGSNYVVADLNGIRSKSFILPNDVGVAQRINLNVELDTDGNGLILVQTGSSGDVIYHDRDEADQTCTQPQDDENFDRDSDDYSDPAEEVLEFLMFRTTELVCKDANFGGELTKEILGYFDAECVECGTGLGAKFS